MVGFGLLFEGVIFRLLWFSWLGLLGYARNWYCLISFILLIWWLFLWYLFAAWIKLCFSWGVGVRVLVYLLFLVILCLLNFAFKLTDACVVCLDWLFVVLMIVYYGCADGLDFGFVVRLCVYFVFACLFCLVLWVLFGCFMCL